MPRGNIEEPFKGFEPVKISKEEKAMKAMRNSVILAVGLFGLLRRAEYSGTWAELFAGMIISVAPVLLIFGLLQQRITKGLTFGAIKG